MFRESPFCGFGEMAASLSEDIVSCICTCLSPVDIWTLTKVNRHWRNTLHRQCARRPIHAYRQVVHVLDMDTNSAMVLCDKYQEETFVSKNETPFGLIWYGVHVNLVTGAFALLPPLIPIAQVTLSHEQTPTETVRYLSQALSKATIIDLYLSCITPLLCCPPLVELQYCNISAIPITCWMPNDGHTSGCIAQGVYPEYVFVFDFVQCQNTLYVDTDSSEDSGSQDDNSLENDSDSGHDSDDFYTRRRLWKKRLRENRTMRRIRRALHGTLVYRQGRLVSARRKFWDQEMAMDPVFASADKFILHQSHPPTCSLSCSLLIADVSSISSLQLMQMTCLHLIFSNTWSCMLQGVQLQSAQMPNLHTLRITGTTSALMVAAHPKLEEVSIFDSKTSIQFKGNPVLRRMSLVLVRGSVTVQSQTIDISGEHIAAEWKDGQVSTNKPIVFHKYCILGKEHDTHYSYYS